MISMKFIIVGRNIEVTLGLRAAVEEKIGKLDKYFNPDTEVHVTLSVEKERQKIEAKEWPPWASTSGKTASRPVTPPRPETGNARFPGTRRCGPNRKAEKP